MFLLGKEVIVYW